VNIALLDRLKRASGFIPWDRLDADHSDLDELEAFGFCFERHPYHGVAYRGPSPRLCPDQIEWELNTRVIGRRVAVWNRVVSTNDLAAKASVSSSNNGLVILAEEQTHGRGRRGRAWSSPPGSSILMSVLLFPTPALDDLGWLTALGAVAAAEVVSQFEGLDARIKWPNDVRVGGRKLAGILVERGQGTVLGIGLNVNVGEFPGEIRDSATSLQRLLGRPLDRSEIARALIQRLDFHHAQAVASGAGSLNDSYRKLSEHFSHMVEVSATSASLVGRLVDLDLRNGLTLELAPGETRQVAGRDVAAIVNRDSRG
jgi:BirA family biotin operon repressor/biotin-[acetyl-CoA-carboxylase] ligase